MLTQREIDSLFYSCQNGSFRPDNFQTFNHVKHLRDTDGRSLLDTAIVFKHVEIVKSLLCPDFLPTFKDLSRALLYAVKTNRTDIFIHVYSFFRAHNTLSHDSSSNKSHKELSPLAFACACENGCVDIVRWFLNNVPNVDVNKHLREVWSRGHVEVVLLLIDEGADVHRRDPTFFQSVLDGSFSILARNRYKGDRGPLLDLLVNKCTLNLADESFWSILGAYGTPTLLTRVLETGLPTEQHLEAALWEACDWDSIDVVKILLEIARKEEYELWYLPTMFESVLAHGKKDLAELFFPYVDLNERISLFPFPKVSDFNDRDTVHVVETSRFGYIVGEDILTPVQMLCYAVACGSRMIVSKLMSLAAVPVYCNILVVNGLSPEPTMLLSHAYDIEIIKMLRKGKARVRGYRGETVLKAVCAKNRPEELKLMLVGYQASVMTRAGKSPFYYAVYSRCAEEHIQDKIAVINHLFDAGASLYDKKGRSVIHVVATGGESSNLKKIIPVLPALVARDPTLLESRYDDETPLLAVLGVYDPKNPLVIQALLEAGADVHARNGKGMSVLMQMFARHSVRAELSSVRTILRLLLDAGADPTVCADDGHSLLMSMVAYDMSGSVDDEIRRIFIGDVLDHIMTRSGVVMED